MFLVKKLVEIYVGGGAAVGSVFGPLGTIAGAVAGGALGNEVGESAGGALNNETEGGRATNATNGRGCHAITVLFTVHFLSNPSS